jgi:hypothetical protein
MNGEEHLDEGTAPRSALRAARVTRWRERARRHVTAGDVRGLGEVFVGGLRQGMRRSAPLEALLWPRGRYLHRRRSGPLPTFRILPFALPPGVEHVGDRRFVIDLHKVTTYCGFSYAPEGWHPFLELLEEYEQNPSLRYEDSALYRLYERFTPATVQEAVFDDPALGLSPLDRLPAAHTVLRALWQLDRRQVEKLAGEAPHRPRVDDQSRYFGPKTHEKGAWHFNKIVRLHESVREHGYDPARFGGERPKGYFLVRGNDYRFVIGHANRRLPALRMNGVRRIVASFMEHVPPVIDETHLDRWTTGQGGVYPPRVARLLFDRMFTATGTERAEALGLG